MAAAPGDKLHVALTKSKMNKPGKAGIIKAASGKKVIKAVAAEAEKFRPDLKARADQRAANEGRLQPLHTCKPPRTVF